VTKNHNRRLNNGLDTFGGDITDWVETNKSSISYKEVTKTQKNIMKTYSYKNITIEWE